MRRLIALTLAGVAVLVVTFAAYVWVGNWFTTRAVAGSSIFASGSCLSNGESFNHVVHAAIGVAQNTANRVGRVEMTADTLKVHQSPSPPGTADTGAASDRCVIRKSDWPDPTALWVDRPLEGSAFTPRGQTLLIRDYDTNHWQVSASRGRFPIEVSWQ